MTNINEDLLRKALELAEDIIDRPDVPSSELVPTMNKLAAFSLRLRHRGAELQRAGDKDEAKRFAEVAKGIELIISTLKYQMKVHLQNRENEGRF